MAPVRVFLSSSAPDAPLVDELAAQLAPLSSAGKIVLWHAGRAGVYGEVVRERDAALERAALLVLLVSADYFADVLCCEEMERILERRREGQVRTIRCLHLRR